MQRIIGVTELQRRFRSVFDDVVDRSVPYVLTRGSRPEAVLVPYAEYLRYQQLEERDVLRRVDALLARLAEENGAYSVEEVEADVAAAAVVVVLEVLDDPGFGKHVLEEQAFAPARVGHHDVGVEALAVAQRQEQAGDALAAADVALEVAQVVMGCGLCLAMGLVGEYADARMQRRAPRSGRPTTRSGVSAAPSVCTACRRRWCAWAGGLG